jgi:hypothetical protein
MLMRRENVEVGYKVRSTSYKAQGIRSAVLAPCTLHPVPSALLPPHKKSRKRNRPQDFDELREPHDQRKAAKSRRAMLFMPWQTQSMPLKINLVLIDLLIYTLI